MDIETNNCDDWDFYIPLDIEINKNETYDDLLEDLIQRQIIYKNKYGWKKSSSSSKNYNQQQSNKENVNVNQIGNSILRENYVPSENSKNVIGKIISSICVSGILFVITQILSNDSFDA